MAKSPLKARAVSITPLEQKLQVHGRDSVAVGLVPVNVAKAVCAIPEMVDLLSPFITKEYGEKDMMLCTLKFDATRTSLAKSVSQIVGEYANQVRDAAEKEKYGSAAAPTGKTEVAGRILSIKAKFDGYGGTTHKVLVRTSDGAKVYGTLNRHLVGAACEGSDIVVRATFEQSKKDSSFGFFKRPQISLIKGAVPCVT